MLIKIHNDDEAPTEVSTEMKSKIDEYSQFCSSEINNIAKKRSKISTRSKSTEVSDITLKQKVRKLEKKSKKTNMPSASSTDSEDYYSSRITEISNEDVLELRTVYKQCKAVMKKIELKYGHILDSSSSDSIEEPSIKRSKLENDHTEESECQCTLNKKIVFDEEGQELTVDTVPSNHICATKLMSKNNIVIMNNQNIKIEYYNKNTELSDNLQELRRILQDPSIEITYRNQVIERLKFIKQVHLNEVRFSKVSLIEKLKTHPDDVFSFNGSNLSDITGYAY